jgi:L,D-transpeptidase-like protein
LSNETTLSRWAYPNYPSKVRSRPSTSARSFTRLRYFTEDERPELYLALRSHVDATGTRWTQLRLPMRPNGRKGWVKRSALGPFSVVRKSLVVNRKTLRATLYRDGRRIWRAPVGVGRPSLPTPAGRFYVREKLRSLDPFYGPVAIGTSAYSTLTDWPGGGVVGLHGTSLPWLVPGRPSHGCIRLRNDDIKRLARLMPVGTPIRIL